MGDVVEDGVVVIWRGVLVLVLVGVGIDGEGDMEACGVGRMFVYGEVAVGDVDLEAEAFVFRI